MDREIRSESLNAVGNLLRLIGSGPPIPDHAQIGAILHATNSISLAGSRVVEEWTLLVKPIPHDVRNPRGKMARKKRLEGTVFRLRIARSTRAEMGGQARMDRTGEISQILPAGRFLQRVVFGDASVDLGRAFSHAQIKKPDPIFIGPGQVRLMAL
jgi:hypothetical protein